MPALRIVDSVTELDTRDAGCLAVTGSHGGLSSARFATVSRPLLAVFNDAGVGRDAAGVAGLALLQREGLAACAVSHLSARIGDARSTLNDGIIADANALAAALGVAAGQTCSAALAAVQAHMNEQDRRPS
jgi:hypothetical protein